MFGWFKKDPVKELTKRYEAKREEAMNLQRGGDIQAFARATKEAEALYDELEQLKASQS